MDNPTTDTVLNISGWHYAGCISKVTSALFSVAGVNKVRVNPVTQRASISASQGTNINQLIQAIRSVRYDHSHDVQQHQRGAELIASLGTQLLNDARSIIHRTTHSEPSRCPDVHRDRDQRADIIPNRKR